MRSVPWWGVLSSAAAPALLIGGWTVAARLQPGHFDSVSGTISALAADDAQHRWVMTAALAGVGAAHVTTALALRPSAPAGRWLIAAGGIGTALVAANPLPAEGASSPRHFAAAGVAFVSLGVWPALSWHKRRSAGAEVPAVFRPEVALPVAAVLVAGLSWFFVELTSDTDRVGLSERVAAGAQALWPLAAVLASRRSRSRGRLFGS